MATTKRVFTLRLTDNAFDKIGLRQMSICPIQQAQVETGIVQTGGQNIWNQRTSGMYIPDVLLCLEEFSVEYKNYVVKKRARFMGISGDVNIPYGTHLEAQNGYLLWNGKLVCAVNSQNGLDYFAQNDDGRGEERGKLTTEIISILVKRNKNYQARWNRVWEDKLCQKYRMTEHEDYWLWNRKFYAAPIEDLQHIRELIMI